MPKRKVTPRQRAASRKNLVKARAAKKSSGIPHGKMQTLYHGTSEKNAAKILTEGFKRYESRDMPRLSGKTFFSTVSKQKHSFGTAQLSVKVSRRKILHGTKVSDSESWVMVDHKDLQGKKIRRIR